MRPRPAKNIPGILIETHIMVGFPGETDADFYESIHLVKELTFWKVEVYRYQDRPETTAANLSDKISEKVIAKRVRTFKKETKSKLNML